MPLLFLFLILLARPAQAADQSVKFTKIAASLPAKQEWIEISNVSPAQINIEGWRFREGGTNHKLSPFRGDFLIDPAESAVIANDAETFASQYPDYTGTVIDSAWGSLKEDGELIELVDAGGVVVDSLVYPVCGEGILVKEGGEWKEIFNFQFSIFPPKADQPRADNQAPNRNDPASPAGGQIPIINKIPNSLFSARIDAQSVAGGLIPTIKAVAGDDQIVNAGEEVRFDASGSSWPESATPVFNWEFGDGERAVGLSATHIYSIEGDYKVRLTLLAGEEREEDEVKVVVKIPNSKSQVPPPKADQPRAGNPNNQLITIQGVVMVEPGILAKTYFYIETTDGSHGYQVYQSGGDFPDLFIGQLVEVAGEPSIVGGIDRIKVKQAGDITIISGFDPPAAVVVAPADVSEQYLGRLIAVSGEIVKDQGKILVADQGSELRLEIKDTTAIVKTDLKEGERWQISGILDQTRGGYRLLPRCSGDVVKLADKAAEVSTKKSAITPADQAVAAALNEIDFDNASSTVKGVKVTDNRRQIIKYLIATAVAIGIVWVGWKVKEKKISN